MQSTPSPTKTLFVNDVHSKLNRTQIREIVRPSSSAEVRALVRRARREGLPLSVCGGRHAMGGQAFAHGGVLLDLDRLDQVEAFDPDERTIRVQAGIRWPELIAAVRSFDGQGGRPLSIIQKQTGADRMSLGGSLAANIHGRGLGRAPIAADVCGLTLVDAEGEVHECSPSRNSRLFSLVLGGYGLFGVVVSVTLQLEERVRLRRRVQLRTTDGLMQAFEERRRAGARYGDFQFAVDPESPDFLLRGVFSTYEPASRATPEPASQRVLAADDWSELLFLAHTDKTRAFQLYADHYQSTDGQIYDSDTHQLAPYLDDYHEEIDRRRPSCSGTEVITELYAPRANFDGFLQSLRESLRRTGADLIYGTVRLIERDEVSFMPWAREPWACVVLNLHVHHTPTGLPRAREQFRDLAQRALDHDGSFYLTYHRWALPDQLRRAHPKLDAFLDAKLEFDPDQRFRSDWHVETCRSLGRPGRASAV